MVKCNACGIDYPHLVTPQICNTCIERRKRLKKTIQRTRNDLLANKQLAGVSFPNLISKVADKMMQDDVSEKTHDPVNSPTHYTSGTIECIEAIRAHFSQEEYRGFLRGNSFKYRWRYRQKNGVEDLKKAEWYEKKLLELESKQ